MIYKNRPPGKVNKPVAVGMKLMLIGYFTLVIPAGFATISTASRCWKRLSSLVKRETGERVTCLGLCCPRNGKQVWMYQ